MRKLALFRVGVLAPLILGFAAIAGRAQSEPAASSPAPPSTQAPASSTDPKGSPSSAAGTAQAAPPASSKPPAKVWTNDQIGDLRRESAISIVGKNPQQNRGATSAKAKGYSTEKDPNWYRKQLQPLQAEIDQLNVQIEKTKAFLNGERVTDPPASPSAYYRMSGNPQEQLRKLEDKRDKDVAKMNDLLDRARHNDIPPGDLR